MAQITWRNVEAPDFRSSLAGIQTFGSLITDAFSGLNKGLDTFDQSISNKTNSAFNLALMKYQDPELLKAAMAKDPTLGFDPNRLSGASIANAGARPGVLLNQALGEANLGKVRTDIAQGAAADEMSDEIVAAQLMVRSNDPVERAKGYALIAANKDQLGKMGFDRATRVPGLISDSEAGGLNIANTRQSMQFGAENQGWTREDRIAETQGLDAGLEASRIAETGGDAYAYLDGLKLSGRARAAAERSISGRVSAGFLGAGSPVSGGGPVDISGIDNSDYGQMLISLESGGNPNAKAGTSSATGLHQFTSGTWLGTVKQAKPAWANGLNDAQILVQRTNPKHSAEMELVLRKNNAAQLERIGAPITNSNLYAMHHFSPKSGLAFARAGNNTPISNILSPQEINSNPYLRGKTKGDVLGNWAKRAGMSPNALNAQSGEAVKVLTTQDVPKNTTGDNLSQGSARDFADILTGQAPEGSFSKDSPKPIYFGRLKDYTPEQVTSGIQAIYDKAIVNGQPKMTYEEAANVFAANSKPKTVTERVWNAIGLRNPGDARVNEAVDNARSGDNVNRAAAVGDIQAATAQAAAATEAATAAQIAYNQFLVRNANRPAVIAANEPRYRAQRDAAAQRASVLMNEAARLNETATDKEAQTRVQKRTGTVQPKGKNIGVWDPLGLLKGSGYSSWFD